MKMRKLLLNAVCVFAACFLSTQALATPQVQLTPSLPSPQSTGTAVNLVAAGSDTDPGLLTYRYSVANRGVFRVVRDYSQDPSFNWSGVVSDGLYLVQVTVRNNSTQQTAKKNLLFQFSPRVAGNQPVVSATANPLVALFSAPACARGSRIRVRFEARGGTTEATDWRACDPASTSNVYVAGMRQNTRYSMAAQVLSGSGISTGPALTFMTGSAPSNLPVVSQAAPIDSNTSPDNVLLIDSLSIGASVGYPVATDLYGRPIWYYAAFNDPAQAGGLLTRVLPGGTMLVLANGKNSVDATSSLQILREIDFAGNALRETNAARVREQLDAMGLVSDCAVGGSFCAVTTFHHDAIRLANGHTLVIGSAERMYPAGTQGSTGPVDVLGDIVIDLDEDFQVAWYWDAFEHLDVNRAAVLHETCANPQQGGCPPVFLASISNDWLHPNAIQVTPDRNLLISLRHQDWVIKVDYQDGAGDGHVLWRLGAGGDFALSSSDPYPWFTHQHDAGFESNGTFTVFDNGNTRVADNPGVIENSRGQAYQIDEANRVATLAVNSDLGVYSNALGSAQRLTNGNYHFLAGFVSPGPTQYSQSIEVLPDGTTNLRLQSPQLAYRSFRIPSLYAPPGT
jgi:hypothetical protein